MFFFCIFVEWKNENIYNFFANAIFHLRVFFKLEKSRWEWCRQLLHWFWKSKEWERVVFYYTELFDFIEPFKDDYSAISKYAVDCKNENQKWLSLTTFSKGMGKGEFNNQSNPNEIIFPQSNTVYFFIIKNVCNYRK